MDIEQRRKWSGALRLVYQGEPGLLTVAAVFDILGLDVIASGGVIVERSMRHARASSAASALALSKFLTVLYPEKRRYTVQNQTMTEAAIAPGLLRDLYVSLGEPLDDGAWSVRLYHKPFIDWIWGGCVVMALGGVLAVSDRRYRLAWRRNAVAVPAAAPLARQTVA